MCVILYDIYNIGVSSTNRCFTKIKWDKTPNHLPPNPHIGLVWASVLLSETEIRQFPATERDIAKNVFSILSLGSSKFCPKSCELDFLWFSDIFCQRSFRSVTVYIRSMIHISCGLLHGIQFWGAVDAITEALKKAGKAREKREKLGLKQQRCSKHGWFEPISPTKTDVFFLNQTWMIWPYFTNQNRAFLHVFTKKGDLTIFHHLFLNT